MVPQLISKPLKSLTNLVSPKPKGDDKSFYQLRSWVLDAIDSHDQVLRSLDAMSYMQTLLDDDQSRGIACHVQYLLVTDMAHQLGEMRESLDRLRSELSRSRD